MPSFYFHVEGEPEPKGMELSNLAAAKCEAMRYAAQLVCDQAEGFWDAAEFSLTVTDGTGLTLFAIAITGTEAPAIRRNG